jgi:CRP-like cAMP-binding protein
MADHQASNVVARLLRVPDIKNSILRRLSPVDLDCMRPFLEFVQLKERAVLLEQQRRIQNIDFVETGVVSLTTLSTGSMVEAATVDFHGAVGFSVALGATVSAHRSVVLVAGMALRISADNLRRCMDERPQIRDNILRFVHSFMVHSSQTALCGIRHDLESRLARWLSLVCDALNCSALAITHDQLSEILGSRRATVTKTLLRLEEQGLVEKTRGVLQVRDRGLLRQKACCCYHVISDAYQAKDARGLVCT